jgi:hypothetical protein
MEIVLSDFLFDFKINNAGRRAEPRAIVSHLTLLYYDLHLFFNGKRNDVTHL